MKKYDVIMTLGNGLSEDWTLPPIVEIRLMIVAALYNQDISTKVLVSGKYSYSFELQSIKPPTTEAREMKKRLVKLGVYPSDIMVESESMDTVGNFYFSKMKYLKPLNLRHILVVCTDFHLKRVKYLSHQILGPEYRVDYKTTPSNSIHMKDFMHVQEAIFHAQSRFLEQMVPGDDTFLAHRLYNDPYYTERLPEHSSEIAMRGAQ